MIAHASPVEVNKGLNRQERGHGYSVNMELTIPESSFIPVWVCSQLGQEKWSLHKRYHPAKIQIDAVVFVPQQSKNT